MLFKDLENINSNIAAELSKHNINEMTDVQAKTYKHIYNNKIITKSQYVLLKFNTLF